MYQIITSEQHFHYYYSNFFGLLDIAELQICQTPQSSYWLENLEGSIFAWLFVWLFVCHGRDSSDVTLALEDAQVVRRSVGRYWLFL